MNPNSSAELVALAKALNRRMVDLSTEFVLLRAKLFVAARDARSRERARRAKKPGVPSKPAKPADGPTIWRFGPEPGNSGADAGDAGP